jgi:hypothetical protein
MPGSPRGRSASSRLSPLALPDKSSCLVTVEGLESGNSLAAPRGVIARQAGELVVEPPGAEDPEQTLYLSGGGLLSGDDDVEPFCGQRDEGQVVGHRRRLAGDPRVRQPSGDRRCDLHMTGGSSVVPVELAGTNPDPLHFSVEQQAGLGPRLAVDQTKAGLGDVGQTRSASGHVGSQYQAFPPGAKADHISSLTELLSSLSNVVFTRLVS